MNLQFCRNNNLRGEVFLHSELERRMNVVKKEKAGFRRYKITFQLKCFCQTSYTIHQKENTLIRREVKSLF